MIYLIGGASRSGKSVLARRFASLLGISAVSTDHMVQGFAAMPEMDFKTDTADDSRAQKMRPFIREFLARTAHSGQSLVIEGVHLLPEIVQEIQATNPQARACFLGFAESTPERELIRIRQHPKYPGDWLAGCTDAEALPCLAGSIERSQRDVIECRNANLTYFETTPDFSATQQAAIDFLRQTSETPTPNTGH